MKRDAVIAAIIAAMVPALPIWQINTIQAVTMAVVTWGMSFVALVGTEVRSDD